MTSETVRLLFKAIDESDWGMLRKLFHEDIVYERPGYPFLTGIDRVLEFYQHERIIADGKHHLERIIVDNQTMACWGRITGLLKDGKEVNEGFADVYECEGGKVKFRRSYFFRPAV
jgi:ketosteroid isomerase-like protein